jgi:hypothetical protein
MPDRRFASTCPDQFSETVTGQFTLLSQVTSGQGQIATWSEAS